MTDFQLEILDEDGRQKAAAEGKRDVSLFYEGGYEPGDRIVIRVDPTNVPCWLVLHIDAAIGSQIVYLAKPAFTFCVPFDEKRKAWPPIAFTGERHLVSVREADSFEYNRYRNLALNSCDQKQGTGAFPHAVANTETRGESVFEARNVIDGLHANHSHGRWPFDSWGINQQKDAELTIFFGRPVQIDQMRFYLRADFPHDSWWTQGMVDFSDGSSMEIAFEKTGTGQSVCFPVRTVEWVRLYGLIKADDESPFPSLRQWEVFGTEV